MKAFENSEKAKSLLLDLETYVTTISKMGPTGLTVYLENFAAKLMEIYYGYEFINLNYIKKNIAKVDLFNESNNHAVQFTIENNNSEKVKNSIENYHKYNKITVFFFDHNSTNRISNNLQKAGIWKENLEVISLHNILLDIEKDAEKAEKYYRICDLWINGNLEMCTDIINSFNLEMQKKIEANRRSRKYIPEIYISETRLKKACRNFVDPDLSAQLLFQWSKNHYSGACYEELKGVTSILKNGETLSFDLDCCADDIIQSEYSSILIPELVKKLENYNLMCRSMRDGSRLFYKDGREISQCAIYSDFEGGIGYTIDDILRDYEVAKKKIFFIVKDAGQGKTNFLCDFCETVLVKRCIPVVYINVNELTNSILETVQNHISTILNREFCSGIELLKQYCEVENRKLLIVIDGLNEKNNLTAFRNEVLELLRMVDRWDFIKVLATSRNVAYKKFFESFKEESFGDLIEENIEINDFRMLRKDRSFREKLYRKYREYFNVGCYVSKQAKEKLSNDTLLLRIFSEVYSNDSRAVVNDIFLYGLFNDYVLKRASQLESVGAVKRKDDFFALLLKIAETMIESQDLNSFTYENFSGDERDLIDRIVEEDIIIKSNEGDETLFLEYKTSFVFTYDEFRDFLIAIQLLTLYGQDFDEQLNYIFQHEERYEGVLKYLFIFCKTNKDERISFLQDADSYNKIYSENIFSIDDSALLEDDINLITEALKDPMMKGLYHHVCRRLDVTRYINLSIINIVDCYLNNFQDIGTWEEIFVREEIYTHEEIGILPDLILEKWGDTTVQEVYGMILFLSTFPVYSCQVAEKYLVWLKDEHPTTFLESLNRIKREYEDLCEGIKTISSIVGV